ncbi:GntR family transcriptional regulator [candidate division KSB3 bacterium]|uniref:GntR family transcriptional regulator n=1 Tax=candidate division KSB3 bacterium TaxID=2044937 RepID=A0A2G6E196_9BACT|nr:MAG: GntR family transcriptional regulator [candidate division KSB3 bacterium]PIE28464.1 MAG: GntR family transcriptional regulator [candidate division KSB3 bacterium]
MNDDSTRLHTKKTMVQAKTDYTIHRQSLSEQVYKYIKRLILSGELKGGQKIPEEKIAQQFGVSRTPIREALRRLDEYGLVYLKPRSYAVAVQLIPEEAEDVAQVRAQLEVLSTRLLVENGTQDDFDALEQLAKECQEALDADDVATAFEKDSQFHIEIARRTGNRHLCELFQKIDAKMQLLRLVLHLPHDKLSQFIAQHKPLLEYMRRQEKDAAETLMAHHILDQLNYFQEHS